MLIFITKRACNNKAMNYIAKKALLTLDVTIRTSSTHVNFK